MRVHMSTPDGEPVDIECRQVPRGGRYRWLVGWCSRWDLVDELARAGRLEREAGGPGTFGHVDFFYP